MGTRKWVGIGLLYRPARARICKPFKEPGIDSQPGWPVRQPHLMYRLARLHRLALLIPRNRFLGSLNVYKYGLRLQFPTRRMIRGIFVWSSSELWSFFKNSRSKLKNQKPKAVDVLFQAYPMVSLSGWSNLARWYLKLEVLSPEADLRLCPLCAHV